MSAMESGRRTAAPRSVLIVHARTGMGTTPSFYAGPPVLGASAESSHLPGAEQFEAPGRRPQVDQRSASHAGDRRQRRPPDDEPGPRKASDAPDLLRSCSDAVYPGRFSANLADSRCPRRPLRAGPVPSSGRRMCRSDLPRRRLIIPPTPTVGRVREADPGTRRSRRRRLHEDHRHVRRGDAGAACEPCRPVALLVVLSMSGETPRRAASIASRATTSAEGLGGCACSPPGTRGASWGNR